MSDWVEKEWDEPGPDFGKVYLRKRASVKRTCPNCEPQAQALYAASEDKHVRVLESIRWRLHSVNCLGMAVAP